MAEGVLAVQEERVRVGGVNLTKKTVIAATEEGVVAVQVQSVEPALSLGYGASGYPPIRSQPTPALPAPVTYTDGAEKNCCERGWCECDPNRSWYSIYGKGWGVVLLLLLMYLVFGVIAIPICLCLCICTFCFGNKDD